MAPQFACVIAAMSGRRTIIQTFYSSLSVIVSYASRLVCSIDCIEMEKLHFVELKTTVGDSTKMGACYFRDELKCTKQSEFRLVFTFV
ncbi:hypothetical protein TNCV_4513241 [Trichonephila clavipes]|nr:hypothetical protein TNCV_4513241 [Trichonephila clavipes]